jgi:hypothetical protein
MHFPQIRKVSTRIRREMASPGDGSAGYALLTFVNPSGSASRSANVYLAQLRNSTYRVGAQLQGQLAIAQNPLFRYFCIAGAQLTV